jgi:hypothetical protein
MSAHKPLHLFEAKSADTRISRDEPAVARLNFSLANGEGFFLDTCWNAYSCEQSGPSKQHRLSPEGVQATIRPIPGTK